MQNEPVHQYPGSMMDFLQGGYGGGGGVWAPKKKKFDTIENGLSWPEMAIRRCLTSCSMISNIVHLSPLYYRHDLWVNGNCISYTFAEKQWSCESCKADRG